MALTHAQVSVGTTATLLSSASAGRDGQTVLVQNPTSGVNVFVGGAGVTTSSYGYLLQAGSAFAIDLQGGEGIYAVVASSTQAVGVIRQGV
jgi:hypothetical protein